MASSGKPTELVHLQVRKGILDAILSADAAQGCTKVYLVERTDYWATEDELIGEIVRGWVGSVGLGALDQRFFVADRKAKCAIR